MARMMSQYPSQGKEGQMVGRCYDRSRRKALGQFLSVEIDHKPFLSSFWSILFGIIFLIKWER